MTLLSEEGELHLLGAEHLLQLLEALGPPLPQHGDVEVVSLPHLAHSLLVLAGESRRGEVQGLRSLMQLTQLLPRLLQQGLQPLRRILLLLNMWLLTQTCHSVPFKGDHELVGDHAVGAEQLGAREAVGNSRRVDGLTGGARGGGLGVASARGHQLLSADVDRS